MIGHRGCLEKSGERVSQKEAIMLKKLFMAALAATLVLGGVLTSCSDDDDDDEFSQSDCYGTYTGTLVGLVTLPNGTTKDISQDCTITVAEDSVSQGENYGAYTKVLWLKNGDSKFVVAAQSDSTNTKNGDLTTDNYTTAASCYIVFNGDGTAVYTVPSMNNASANITKQ